MPIPFRKLKQSRPGIGPLLLYVLPLPLLIVIVHSLTTGNFRQLVLSLCTLGGIWLSAWFLKRAHYYEWESNRRKWTRSSRFPWRSAASTLTGISVFVITFGIVGHNIFIAALGGILASAGVILRYGLDPQFDGDKDASLFGITTEELVEIFDEAENNLREIELAAKNIKNRELKDRLQRIVEKTREILALIEQDPKDLRRARKFLKVYLHGARAVSSQYASSPHAKNDQELEQNFRNVLNTIEDVIEEQKLKLRENDILDLDVKIEVLEAQLKHEGVV